MSKILHIFPYFVVLEVKKIQFIKNNFTRTPCRRRVGRDFAVPGKVTVKSVIPRIGGGDAEIKFD